MTTFLTTHTVTHADATEGFRNLGALLTELQQAFHSEIGGGKKAVAMAGELDTSSAMLQVREDRDELQRRREDDVMNDPLRVGATYSV